MAQYKVPQDVEADDKLLGPFTFRQFVYLLITAALIGVTIFLFQLFPLLALIPLPFAFLFGVLALPVKKDQPMETYLAAIVSYYLKPHTRIWTAGQRETTIKITAPKIVEDKRVRDISSEEATHRLSFLADIVDTQGKAIDTFNNSVMRDDLVAEAQSTADMFEDNRFETLNIAIAKDETTRHNALMKLMRSAIAENKAFKEVKVEAATKPKLSPLKKAAPAPQPAPVVAVPATQKVKTITDSPAVVKPNLEKTMAKQPAPKVEAVPAQAPAPQPQPAPAAPQVEEQPENQKTISNNSQKSDIIESLDNSEVAPAIEAESTNEGKEDGEVYISLH